MRWSSYRTPIHGYYHCGASTHPGGGVMGAAGRLAALRILADSGASRAGASA
jgi:phytoene dehydrogenase-like protein